MRLLCGLILAGLSLLQRTSQSASATGATATFIPPTCSTVSGVPAPVDCWPMHEGFGTTFYDGAGTGNNVNATNIIWGTSSGFTGNVPAFNASTASGSNQTATNFTGATAFSACVWAKVSNPIGAQYSLISTLDTSLSSFPGWRMKTNTGGGVEIDLVNNGASLANALIVTETSTTLVNGALVHICFTYDGSKTPAGLANYINGSAQSLTTNANTLTGSIANTVPVQLGVEKNGGGAFSGVMADVRIWNVQLTSTQISTLFSAGPQ